MVYNITTIYVTLMLPIALSYIELKRREEGKTDLYPLLLLLLLLILTYFKGDNNIKVQMFLFKLRGLFN